jgi:cupin fold WbuC family metalloprotein
MLKKNPLKRARFCVHDSPEESIQEMFICVYKESEIKIHRHLNKRESYFLLEGELTLFLYSQNGVLSESISMGEVESGKTFFYYVDIGQWHNLRVDSEYAIIHEVTQGPFIVGDAEFADWSFKC